jgi:condensin-2 complex subunit D3
MCLKDDHFAKKSVEPLVLHLKDGECFSVRNNILLILADLCVMYTSLVDRFVPMMTNCLNSEFELLRKHAAMVLSHLLSEDFIKFRGSIQHRFIYALSDPAPYVREFVEAVFERVLLHRIAAPAVCFVDAITALNGWLGCKLYQGARGNASFCLADDSERRQRVYVFLLDRMTNEKKFAVQAAIVSNLLTLFADDNDDGDAVPLPESYDEPAGKVLRDCLKLLACKEIRVSFAKKETGEEGDDAPGTRRRRRPSADC